MEKKTELNTGIIYDPDTLLHRCGRKHPERPQRVEQTIQHLEAHHILSHPRVSYISTIPPAPASLILTCHSQEYLNHVDNLWTPGLKKKHINVLDSYFNQHSKHVAEVAAGGALIGVDKIMQGEWKNGFAVVRPPGHHSGFRNVINGFCIYNNVAIAVKYLKEKYKVERILIFDWDIHHGDGTQHIFREEEGVLFISLHRFDRGLFYPGESGDYHNVGQGVAEGKHINIPWNTIDDKFQPYEDNPGDNEYIYVFERVLAPIIKKFAPQFIFISAGFDCARSDPIGGFRLSKDSFHYLTTELMRICPKVLGVLEGGYNFCAIANSVESVVQALLKQKLRDPENTLSNQEKKDKCWLPKYYHDTIDEIVTHLSQYWGELREEKQQKYEQSIKGNKGREYGIYFHESSSESGEDGSGSSLSSNGVQGEEGQAEIKHGQIIEQEKGIVSEQSKEGNQGGQVSNNK